MAVTLNPGRQEAIVAYEDIGLADLVGGFKTASVTINAADLTSGADYTTTIALPLLAVVVGGSVEVNVPFDSGTSDTFTVGDVTDDDRYLAGADLQDVAPKALVPTGYIGSSNEPAVVVNWTKVGAAPTQGRITLTVQYYVVADVVTETVSIGYAALTSAAAYTTALTLPVGAVVIGGEVDVLTGFNSGTSDVVVVGDATVANRYVASSDIHTGATTPIPFVPTGFVGTASEAAIKITWTKVSTAPSAGALSITVSYYVIKDVPVINLPQGSQIISGALNVLEAFNSGTSDVMSVGDAASTARYKALTSIASTGRLALVPTDYNPTTKDAITVRWKRLGSTAPTAGKLRLDLKYFRNGRTAFAQD